MDAPAFLGLQPTHNPYRWVLPVTTGTANNRGGLFGGAGLGAGIAAMEAVSGRKVVWAAAQYLAHAHVGSILDIDVTLAKVGREVTQARVNAHVQDTEVLTVNAALGGAESEAFTWARRPDVPGPEDCRTRLSAARGEDSIHGRLELRLASGRSFEDLDGTPGSHRSAMWARMPGIAPMSAAKLAVLGDWVPLGVSQTVGYRMYGVSLDNTLRVVRLVESEWVLADIDLYAFHGGFGHGHVHLWAEDGTLLASASQSAKLLEPRG